MADNVSSASTNNTNKPSPKSWAFIIGGIVILLLILIVFLVAHLSGRIHGGLPIKTPLIFLLALALLGVATYAILQKKNKFEIQYIIAFDITIFVVIGFALVVSAAVRWQTACLVSGAALLGGGFFGLIFGMPLSAASVPSESAVKDDASRAAEVAQNAIAAANTSQTDAAKQLAEQAKKTAQQAAAMTGRIAKHSLLAEAGGTLSKLIAGATLVQVGPIFTEFKKTSEYISVYLLQDSPPNGATLGGALLLYFIFLGFLSGLFLPAYFMQDFWDKQ